MSENKHLELYQFEGCPHCKKVREFCSENGISVVLHNPRNGDTVVNEERIEELRDGGQDQVPFLVDNERGVSMYESDDIVDYLDENYA